MEEAGLLQHAGGEVRNRVMQALIWALSGRRGWGHRCGPTEALAAALGGHRTEASFPSCPCRRLRSRGCSPCRWGSGALAAWSAAPSSLATQHDSGCPLLMQIQQRQRETKQSVVGLDGLTPNKQLFPSPPPGQCLREAAQASGSSEVLRVWPGEAPLGRLVRQPRLQDSTHDGDVRADCSSKVVSCCSWKPGQRQCGCGAPCPLYRCSCREQMRSEDIHRLKTLESANMVV